MLSIKKCLIALMLSLSLNAPAFAKSTSINGSANLSQGEHDTLEVNGSLTVENIVVKNDVLVNGSIKGNNLSCKNLEANGAVKVDALRAQNLEINGVLSGENIEITGKAEINGGLNIKNGKLNHIEIAGEKFTLNDALVNGSIKVNKSNSGWTLFGFKFKEKESPIQILSLKGKSLVMGDVTFEEMGEIHLFDGSEVKGNVVNAKIIKK